VERNGKYLWFLYKKNVKIIVIRKTILLVGGAK